jgi:hypothetical protein
MCDEDYDYDEEDYVATDPYYNVEDDENGD